MFLEEAKQETKVLGWTGSFIEDAVYMLLLLMYNDIATQSKIKLINHVFSNTRITNDEFEILLSNSKAIDTDETEMYLQIFDNWKAIYPASNEQKQEILNWLYKIIQKRVDAIVTGQYRGAYCKAALLVVALGEVYEAANIMKKQQLIQEYIEKFPRHTSFKKEIMGLL